MLPPDLITAFSPLIIHCYRFGLRVVEGVMRLVVTG